MYLFSLSSETVGLISRAAKVSAGEDADRPTASALVVWDAERDGLVMPSFPSWLAISSSSSNLLKRRSSSTLVVLDPPVLPLGNRARFGKTHGRLDRSHAAHGLVLLHFTFRLRQLVQLSRCVPARALPAGSATTPFAMAFSDDALVCVCDGD